MIRTIVFSIDAYFVLRTHFFRARARIIARTLTVRSTVVEIRIWLTEEAWASAELGYPFEGGKVVMQKMVLRMQWHSTMEGSFIVLLFFIWSKIVSGTIGASGEKSIF